MFVQQQNLHQILLEILQKKKNNLQLLWIY